MSWVGEANEPRPGLSSGHMPNAISLPFSDLLSGPSSTDPSYKTLLPRDELRAALLKRLGSDEALQDALDGKVSRCNALDEWTSSYDGKKSFVATCG